MPAIPLPFVVALLLAILFVRALRGEDRFQPATIFIGASLVLVVTVGLRWTFDYTAFRFLQPVVASLLPPVVWLCFEKLRQPLSPRHGLHFLLPVAVFILSAGWQRWHPPIDPILAALYFGYGVALLLGTRKASGDFESVRFSDADGVRKAVLTIGGLLLGSGVTDLLIAADFQLYDGRHAARVVAIANLLTLPVIAYAITVIGQSVPATGDLNGAAPDEAAPPRIPPANPTADDQKIIDAFDTAMREKALFRDPDLTLNRLARRLGIPARQISAAINRVHGRNISQVVNAYRIREAMRLLRETDLPVTAILFECGFQTKSNFNREFARITGTNPSDYRRSGGAVPGDEGITA